MSGIVKREENDMKRIGVNVSSIGFMIMCIGATFADSEKIIIPVSIVAFGAFLIWIDGGFEQ